METARTSTRTNIAPPAGRLRAGLILAIVLGLANLPFVFMPTPDGEEGPPLGVLILGAALGLLSVVTAVVAWRTGSRAALRITVACVIINAVTTIPAFFVDVDAGIKLGASLFVLASVACIVMLLGRSAADTGRERRASRA